MAEGRLLWASIRRTIEALWAAPLDKPNLDKWLTPRRHSRVWVMGCAKVHFPPYQTEWPDSDQRSDEPQPPAQNAGLPSAKFLNVPPSATLLSLGERRYRSSAAFCTPTYGRYQILWIL